MTNCSGNGDCALDSNQNFICVCYEFYGGKTCKQDLRKCSSGGCLWNGTCIDIINGTSYDFECKCPYPYYGRYCQLKINLCANITCSNQGACIVKEITPSCKCYTGFIGENCDQLTLQLQTVRMISNIAAIFAIVAISVFIGLIVLLDLITFVQFLVDGPKKKKKKVKKSAESKKPEKKPTYNDYVPNPE